MCLITSALVGKRTLTGKIITDDEDDDVDDDNNKSTL